jgi:hypothetical protein
MEAAVRAFARKGYHSPRIGEIAEEAGVDEDIARAEQEVLVRPASSGSLGSRSRRKTTTRRRSYEQVRSGAP